MPSLLYLSFFYGYGLSSSAHDCLPEGVVLDPLDVVEGEVQRLQLGVGLAVEGTAEEHLDLVVLETVNSKQNAYFL